MDFKNQPKILGLDVSTKTIGWALFNYGNKELLELTHFSPIIKPKPKDKLLEVIKKADEFGKKLEQVKDFGIVTVIIEEPLLTSNNVYTVGALLRYNSMITKVVYDTLQILPSYISTYQSRKHAFPTLFSPNKAGRKVLFGGYPKGCNKKEIIWKEVKKLEPQIEWLYTRNNTLKKECYDMADAYTCVRGYMYQEGLWN